MHRGHQETRFSEDSFDRGFSRRGGGLRRFPPTPLILKSNTVKPIECLHYVMNLPTSAVITGIDSMEILDQAFEAVRTFKPMSQEQLSALLERTAQAASKGQYKLFKTSNRFDSTANNPEWLGV